ncbi:hypothetical protein SAMN04488243_14714 [Thermus arciformis]|uniref:DDE superfamily endonuclease n=1 Tax=Thermus arciformis TaxID=482827 RepID=A0A1G7KMD0_9DEIN|nr:hypothetical protein SAMN04488243_14714 [Thermus arciformis]
MYGFVRPGTGESEFWLLPTVNAVAFSEVLGRFARLRGAGEGKLLLLVLDRAGWHVSGRVDTEEELWARVEARCAYLQAQPGLIRSHTLFHWWPREW